MPATTTAPRARLPRTLAAIASHPWVESIDDARGSGDGLHVYLRPGFVRAGLDTVIIEPTVKEACQGFKDVVWDPEGWQGVTGASDSEVAALVGEAAPVAPAAPAEAAPAAPAEAAPVAPAAGRRLNPLAEMLLTRLQATDRDWLMVEVCPIVGTLKRLGWIVTRHEYGTGVECQITIHGRHALAARPCDGDTAPVAPHPRAEAAPVTRPVLPGMATPPPARSHGDRAPRLPELCPATPGTPTRAEAVRDVERRDGGGVAVICSGSDREAFRLPDTVSHCGAAAALEAAGWILSAELEALAQRWRDISGDQPPSPEAVAIAEAAAPQGRRFEVFHRTWWRWSLDWPGNREPGAGESHHIGWAQTEARARYMCRRWNASHDAGPLSDRAEYTAA